MEKTYNLQGDRWDSMYNSRGPMNYGGYELGEPFAPTVLSADVSIGTFAPEEAATRRVVWRGVTPYGYLDQLARRDDAQNLQS